MTRKTTKPDPTDEQHEEGQAPAAGPGTPAPTNAVDALAAEVAAEQTANPDGWVAVPLGDAGEEVRVKSPLDWRSSAHAALQRGDFEGWAEVCLAADDYEQVWAPMDPTLREINDMFEEWGRRTGQGSAGKSPSSPRSLRRMSRS